MQIEGEEGEDPVLAFRRTLGMFATGVTVITTPSADQVHGMTANAFMSVSLRPPLVLISVDGRAKMHAMLNEGKRIGISVLSEDQDEPFGPVRRAARRHRPEPSFDVVRETPLVEGALAHLVARVTRSYWGGDHSLFLALRGVRPLRAGESAAVPRRPLRGALGARGLDPRRAPAGDAREAALGR